MEPPIFLRRKEASAYLKRRFGLERAPSTLAKLAVIGGGPPFRRMNRIPLYDPADLDRWVASRLGPRMRSTSDDAGLANKLGAIASPNIKSVPSGAEADTL